MPPTTAEWVWGGVLIALSVVFGSRQLFFGQLADEGDHLAGGLFLAQGHVLYRDTFAHHFPFPYYWSAMVFSLFGPSMFAVRLSMLVFQVLVFLWLMRLTRWPVVLGLTSLLWNLLATYYCGQMVLYQPFCATTLLGLFALTMAVMLGRTPLGAREIATVSFLAGVAVLSYPLSVYLITVSLLGIAGARVGFRHWAITVGAATVPLVLYGIHLLTTGSFHAFWSQAIQFNATTFQKYGASGPWRVGPIVQSAIHLLGVLDSRPLNSLFPMSLSWEHWAFENSWVTGLSYVLAFLAATLSLVLNRNYSAAVFLYASVAAWRGHRVSLEGVQNATFAMLAFFTISWLALGMPGTSSNPQRKIAAVFSSASERLFSGALAILLAIGLWTHVRIIGHPRYERYFSFLEERARRARELAGGRTDVLFADYPWCAYANFRTGLRPPAGYTIMYPWVAEIGLEHVLRALEERPGVVHVDWDEAGVYLPNSVYLARLRDFLASRYVDFGDGWHVAPSLARANNIPVRAPGPAIAGAAPTGELVGGTSVTQTFTCPQEKLAEIAVLPATYGRANTRPLKFTLTDTSSGELVASQWVPAEDVIDSGWLPFRFPALSNSKGRSYRFTVESPESTPGDAVSTFHTASHQYPDQTASFGGSPLGGDLVFRYGYFR